MLEGIGKVKIEYLVLGVPSHLLISTCHYVVSIRLHANLRDPLLLV